MTKQYFRDAVEAMEGYTPGEQPKVANLIKLNTNENPYPPSPAVGEALRTMAYEDLRRYPDPCADRLRDAIGALYGFQREEVIAVNGSDDLLTLVFRGFTSADRPVAVLEPTYSLYSVLAKMQEAPVISVRLDEAADFAMPSVTEVLRQIKEAKFLIVTRPNAPTGNTFAKAAMMELCEKFDGVVLFDEAYADFADDNMLDAAKRYENVLVSRTMSKSYALAGLRLGYAMGNRKLIAGLMKLKDSYNVDGFAQCAALAALQDQGYLAETRAKILATREVLYRELRKLGCRVIEPHGNFVFAAAPDGNGAGWFAALRDAAVLVRYFPGAVTGKYLRISVGTDAEIARLLEVSRKFFEKGLDKKQ